MVTKTDGIVVVVVMRKLAQRPHVIVHKRGEEQCPARHTERPSLWVPGLIVFQPPLVPPGFGDHSEVGISERTTRMAMVSMEAVPRAHVLRERHDANHVQVSRAFLAVSNWSRHRAR